MDHVVLSPAGAESSLLLALPDPWLLQVLQCCANDHRSLFSAARAHSRLHQAAVVALRSITLVISQQQQMDGLMVYLGKHGQQVNSLELRAQKANHEHPKIHLHQLPLQLQLSSLQLEGFILQLQPGSGSQGVLGAAATVAALRQLRLTDCELLDEDEAAALSQLPAGLEHLSISYNMVGDEERRVSLPAGMLQQWPNLNLTYLELGYLEVVGPDGDAPGEDSPLQQLQALTRLKGLTLVALGEVVTPSVLAGMQHLTRLEMIDDDNNGVDLEPDALAGKTRMQHLDFGTCKLRGGAAGAAQLLSHLQSMQQLTHLSVCEDVVLAGGNPPASAYAALTASSKLQYLDIWYQTLPAGVWQHVFPAGRQLPNLQTLKFSCWTLKLFSFWGNYKELNPAPEGSRLVSCCPGLQSLHLGSLQCSAELLAPLQGLSRLQTLECYLRDAAVEVVQAVCQLTGLRELTVTGSVCEEQGGSLMHLAQLKQLTKLDLSCWFPGKSRSPVKLSGDEEPVWRQLLRQLLDHRDPAVAQQAAAALADL